MVLLEGIQKSIALLKLRELIVYSAATLLRTVMAEDKQQVCAVEAKSTPKLRYLPDVFEMFIAEERGEFFLAEQAGVIVACAKCTVLADNTGWLETLRVIPEYQGRGIGKQLYARYFEIARAEGIHTMRMYTGLNNLVSRGLAEYHGFQLEASFLGFSKACEPSGVHAAAHDFQHIQDADQASVLLMPHAAQWNHFVVMNRTFYRLTPALCAYLAQQGHVYADSQSGSVLVLGARFSPQQALHIGLFAGHAEVCLQFAQQHANESGTQQLSCIFPQSATPVQELLTEYGFEPHPSPYIVMRVDM